MRLASLSVLILLASCAAPVSVPGGAEVCVDGTELTWSNFGKPMLSTWCVSCHGAQVSSADRQGAPEGLNFDHLEGVLPHLERILATTATDSWTMPPAGGLSERDRDRLREWIECGAPGTPEVEAGECESLVYSSEMGDDFCDRYNAYAGDLTASEGVDCLCAVEGDLVVSGAAAFPELVEVGGALRLDGAVDLPALKAVGGAVVVEGSSAEAISLPSLRVSESVRIADNQGLKWVDLPRLAELSGSLEVRDNAALEALRNPNALESVGGDLVLSRNPSLNAIDGFHVLTGVGGSVHVQDNTRVESFYGFQSLESVGGDLVIVGNGQFDQLGAFQELVRVGGRLDIAGNASLQVIDTFPWLEEVGHLSELNEGGLTLARNPVLVTITPISFASLQRTRGLIIEDNPSLQSLLGFHALQEVEGDFAVSEHDALDLVCAFSGLGFVGGEFQLIADPALPTCNAERILERVSTVLGGITVAGTDDAGTCARLQAVCGVGG